MINFKTKDSGKRKKWKSGFNRDTDEGKLRYDLIPLELLERLAGLYTRGAVKYGDDNWQKAETQEEIDRFKQSAWRHWAQWMNGEEDEDHPTAVIWNIMAYEWHTRHKEESKQYEG
jgi:hypothetical protein